MSGTLAGERDPGTAGRKDDLPCERAEARRMRGEAITGMRSSLCLLGALLGKCGYVTMEHPGGCVIGDRPIDLHIHALEQMGVEFREEDGLLSARAKKMHGAEITLKFPKRWRHGEYFAGSGKSRPEIL